MAYPVPPAQPYKTLREGNEGKHPQLREPAQKEHNQRT